MRCYQSAEVETRNRLMDYAFLYAAPESIKPVILELWGKQ